MKLTPQQLIVNNSPPTRLSQPTHEPVAALDAVAPATTSYSHSHTPRGKILPELYSVNNQQATILYQQTAQLEADVGELIGVDTYA